MKMSTTLPLIVLTLSLSFSLFAADLEDHKAHHSATTPNAQAPVGEKCGMMENQLKTMQEMHEKMMAAKSPAQRKVLLPEHFKTMQNSMAMMQEMSKSQNPMKESNSIASDGKQMMGTKKMMEGSKMMEENKMKCDMDGDMAKHHEMMQKHMQMMQMMMQLMLDTMANE